MEGFCLFILKNLAKKLLINILIEFFDFFLFQKTHWRKIQNGGQKPRWRWVDFLDRNSTETLSSGFLTKKI
jgi:hypothetical protein